MALQVYGGSIWVFITIQRVDAFVDVVAAAAYYAFRVLALAFPGCVQDVGGPGRESFGGQLSKFKWVVWVREVFSFVCHVEFTAGEMSLVAIIATSLNCGRARMISTDSTFSISMSSGSLIE